MTLSLKPRGLNRFRNALLLSCLLLTSVMACIGTPAGAVTVQNYQLKRPQADATWFQQPNDCTISYISLSAFQVLIRGQSTPVLNLVINTSDCTGGFGYLDGTTNDVQFSAKATNSATLTGTVSAHGCAYDGSGMLLSCTDHAVDINLEWTATGAVARGQFINHIQGPDGMSMERSLGVTAPADATGTVKEDGNLDLISGVSTYAYIYSLDYGSLTITRP